MSATLRPATPEDLAAIQAIYAHHVRHGTGTFELDPPSLADMRSRYEGLVDGGYPYFVAEAAGGVVGYGYAGPYRPRAAYRFTVEDSIYLHPDHRGRGLGRQLLDRLIAESRARGFRQMIAVIGDSENRASVRLHLAAGFIEIGSFRDVGYKFDRWLDTVLMQRALGPDPVQA